MKHERESVPDSQEQQKPVITKKPYEKPTVRSEPLFEAVALGNAKGSIFPEGCDTVTAS